MICSGLVPSVAALFLMTHGINTVPMSAGERRITASHTNIIRGLVSRGRQTEYAIALSAGNSFHLNDLVGRRHVLSLARKS